MSRLPFTLRQLEVFEHLCRLRSFRLASETLGISQASVSNQIKALESQLGIRLLTRAPGKRPQLTPPGAAFLADLMEFWKAADTLASHRNHAGSEADEKPVELQVLVGSYLFKDYIRPRLDQFFEAYPLVQLNIVIPTMDEEPHRMIERGTFDLALFQDAASIPLKDGFRELARVRCGIFGHRKFIEGRNSPLTAEEVSAMPFLLPPAGTFYENAILGMLAGHGIKPRQIAGRSNFFDVMSAMFERGTSVGVTIEPLLERSESRNSVLLFRLEDWRLTAYHNPAVQTAQAQAAEQFLIASVLDGTDYPALVESEMTPIDTIGD